MHISSNSDFEIRRALNNSVNDPKTALDTIYEIIEENDEETLGFLYNEIFPIVSNEGYGWIIDLVEKCEDDRIRLKILMFLKDKLLPKLRDMGLGYNPSLFFGDEIHYEILKVIISPGEFDEDFTIRDFRDSPDTIFPEYNYQIIKGSTENHLSYNEVTVIKLQSDIVFGYYARFYRNLLSGNLKAAEENFQKLRPIAERVLGKKDLFGVAYAYINALQEMYEGYLKESDFQMARRLAEEIREIVDGESALDEQAKKTLADFINRFDDAEGSGE